MSIPRSEYPRPQFVREGWMNLNGQWQFEIDQGRSGEIRGLQKEGTQLSGEITVPFCPESKLSGVQYVDFMYGVWYKRTVTLPKQEGRTVLHFGAVDYHCRAFVNGQLVAVGASIACPPIPCRTAQADGQWPPLQRTEITSFCDDHIGHAVCGKVQLAALRPSKATHEQRGVPGSPP